MTKKIGFTVLIFVLCVWGGTATAWGSLGMARWRFCDLPVMAAPATDCCIPPPAPVTCLVPEIVMEKQKRTVTRYRPEIRERTVIVNRPVSEKKIVQEEYFAMVPERRTRTVEAVVGRPAEMNLQLRTTTMIPRTEIRQATRTVQEVIPVEEVRTVCETVDPCAIPETPSSRRAADREASRVPVRTMAYTPGGNEKPGQIPATATGRDPNEPPPPPPANESPSASACDSCSPCSPTVVRRNVRVTCLKPVSRQETVDYPVTRFDPEVDSRRISFTVLEPSKQIREEEYMVEVPQKRTRAHEVIEVHSVPVREKKRYKVMVPYQEEIETTVPRLRWVPQAVPGF